MHLDIFYPYTFQCLVTSYQLRVDDLTNKTSFEYDVFEPKIQLTVEILQEFDYLLQSFSVLLYLPFSKLTHD